MLNVADVVVDVNRLFESPSCWRAVLHTAPTSVTEDLTLVPYQVDP